MAEMLLGSVLVPDIANPRPEDVDIRFMRYRLGQMRRFSGNPDALTVKEHQSLCGRIALQLRPSLDVIQWAEHHDDHEYATGDIATPLQKAFGMDRIRAVQARWDVAICEALGFEVPAEETRKAVAFVDAVALGLEWRWALKRDIRELGLDIEIVEHTADKKLVGLMENLD